MAERLQIEVPEYAKGIPSHYLKSFDGDYYSVLIKNDKKLSKAYTDYFEYEAQVRAKNVKKDIPMRTKEEVSNEEDKMKLMKDMAEKIKELEASKMNLEIDLENKEVELKEEKESNKVEVKIQPKKNVKKKK